MKKQFLKGIKDGLPIGLGYFSVSFGFGILCINLGLPVWAAVVTSLTNLTSAGQVAGVGVMAAGGSLLEMALTQLVINSRYCLMGLSLSQKLGDGFTTPHRMLAAHGITDEIFAVAYAQEGKLQPIYLYGMTGISVLGWVSGTFLGAVLGQVLPQVLSDAMGIMLYGMFLAVVIPPARKERGILMAALLAALCSMVFTWLLTMVSGGFAVIISAVLSAAVCAWLFPKNEEADV